ncbi:MAG: TIGR04053 family radical SAM/SPASM domain-containing protein [Thermoplasmata archaeon]
MMSYNFEEKPLLIFWETTKACGLKCEHCRASAILDALPDEMSYEQSINFLSGIKNFSKPYPIVILTGGDMLRKRRIYDIMDYLKNNEIPFSVSPAVTDLLNDEAILSFKKYGVSAVSISLDGMKETHEKIRGVSGVFENTISVINKLIKNNITMQVNTVVMKSTVHDLPDVLKVLLDSNVKVWEVFFLIRTGRGIDKEDLTPEEYEDVNKWLLYISGYGLRIRTVESPIYRRIIMQHSNGEPLEGGDLFNDLSARSRSLLGEPSHPRPKSVIPTRDGYGIVFISHNGDVYPSGFLPYSVGNVKKNDIASIYRNSETLMAIRNPANLKGKCNVCRYRDICGGSRARAYSVYGDMYAEDPSCVYIEPQ